MMDIIRFIIRLNTAKALILIAALHTTIWAVAQTEPEKENSKIALMPRTSGDSIVLRWITDNPKLLSKGLEKGYSIKRADLIIGGWSDPVEVAMIKPWDKAKWDQHLASLKDTNTSEYKNFKAAYELIVKSNEYLPTDLSDLSAIQMAKAQNELTFLFSILVSCTDRLAADAMGLRWVDKNVEFGKKYKYQIELMEESEEERLPSAIETEAVPHVSNAAAKLTVIENERNIILRWLIAEEPIIGYSLERSEDGGKKFTRMNSSIILMSSTQDSLEREVGSLADTAVELYKPYVYKVIGHTLFADEVLIGRAEGMARDRTPFAAIFVPNPEPTGTKKAIITWELTDNPKDLVGFNVRRDISAQGRFESVLNKSMLSPSTTQFDDIAINFEEPNYYLVETIDTAGNSFFSNPVYLLQIDSFPPAAPVWLRGSVDSNGVVKLVLNANKEKDLMGYRIQRANQADHEFSTFLETYERNDTLPKRNRDSVFYDTTTLETLTKNIYYRVFALDFHYNQSEPSQILILARPDIVPPTSPVLKNIDVAENSLQLNIIPSSSADVQYTKIYRRSSVDSILVNYAMIGGKDTMFNDTFVITGNLYEYSLQAIDSNDLVSLYSIAMGARPFDNGLRKGIENFEASFSKESETVRLIWDYSLSYVKPGEKLYFIIYRSSPLDSNALLSYKSFEYQGNNSFFNDEDVKAGRDYQYAIKVSTDIGAESLMSEIRKVAVRKEE